MKDREGPDGILKIVSLIQNKNVRTIKTKVTVSIDLMAVEEVMDL